MNLRQIVDDIEAGGFGSGPNPEKGPIGRRPKSTKSRKINADAMLKEAEDMYGDGFRVMLSREIRDAYPGKELKGWGELTLGQKRVVAQRCHAKAQDRMRAEKMRMRVRKDVRDGIPRKENVAEQSRNKPRQHTTWRGNNG